MPRTHVLDARLRQQNGQVPRVPATAIRTTERRSATAKRGTARSSGRLARAMAGPAFQIPQITMFEIDQLIVFVYGAAVAVRIAVLAADMFRERWVVTDAIGRMFVAEVTCIVCTLIFTANAILAGNNDIHPYLGTLLRVTIFSALLLASNHVASNQKKIREQKDHVLTKIEHEKQALQTYQWYQETIAKPQSSSGNS